MPWLRAREGRIRAIATRRRPSRGGRLKTAPNGVIQVIASNVHFIVVVIVVVPIVRDRRGRTTGSPTPLSGQETSSGRCRCVIGNRNVLGIVGMQQQHGRRFGRTGKGRGRPGNTGAHLHSNRLVRFAITKDVPRIARRRRCRLGQDQRIGFVVVVRSVVILLDRIHIQNAIICASTVAPTQKRWATPMVRNRATMILATMSGRLVLLLWNNLIPLAGRYGGAAHCSK